jgi:hypothetical protein
MPPARMLPARAAYLIAAAATAVMIELAASGKFTPMMIGVAGFPASLQVPGFPFEFMTTIKVIQTVGLATLLGGLVFLMWRPFWWGKLICFAIGLTWVAGAGGFGLITGFNPIVDCQIGAGVALLLAALLHQIADPRFGP